MSAFDQLEHALVATSRRLAAASAPPQRQVWRGPVPIIVTTSLLIAGTALAATQPWRPSLGDRRLGAPPAVSPNAPAKAELAILHVLRRPQTSSDRGRATTGALRFVGRGGSGIKTDYIRLLGLSAPSRGIVLIPMNRYSPGPGIVKQGALCVIYSEPTADGAAKSCFDLDDIRYGRAVGSLGLHQYGLVPDGVAKVTALFAEGPVVEATVRDNFFDLTAPQARGESASIAANPAAISWQDAGGRPVGPPPG